MFWNSHGHWMQLSRFTSETLTLSETSCWDAMRLAGGVLSVRIKATGNGFEWSHLHFLSFCFQVHRPCLAIVISFVFRIELGGDFMCVVCQPSVFNSRQECRNVISEC